jgi:hypothetical protein
MRLIDVECLTCGKQKEIDLSQHDTNCPIIIHCDCMNKLVEHKRLWSAPRLGSMSSGEPPR